MDRREHLEQPMWEFVYGLLPDDEAGVIREQITADSDVARLYAEVKLCSELVAEASRLNAPPVPLPIPPTTADRMARQDRSQVAAVRGAAGSLSAAAALRWAVTLAATLLVGFVAYAYFKPHSPLRPVAFQAQRQQLTEQPVQTMLLAPRRLQSQPANHLAVVTRSLVGDARSTPVVYRLYGEEDRLLAEAEAVTDAAGILQFQTPATIVDRTVRLEVQTPGDSISAPLSYTFDVDQPELITHLSLDQPLGQPGQSVRFRTVTLTRYDLRVDREVAVVVEITDDTGNVLEGASRQAMTENGVSHGQLRIPDDLPDGLYRVVASSPTGYFHEVAHPLTVAVDGERDAPRKEIPGRAGAFSIDFFPESGDLVAGVSNRVYFHARDRQGQPVHVAGQIVDGAGRWQTDVRTQHDGRGVFSLTPQVDQTYRLEIDAPDSAGFSPRLPLVDPQRWLVLDTGPGVFEPGSDLAITVRSTDCSRPLAVTATCRGTVVGQQIVTADRFLRRETEPDWGYCSVQLPVAERAEGVIRVTAFDLSVQPAVPVAERLVYRRPARSLQMQISGLRSHYRPGEQVEILLDVRDETGQEQPAVLGITVVDDLSGMLGTGSTAGLTAYFWLTAQLGDAHDLEDADFYLDPQRPEAARALDLLLGTQGWRRLSPLGEGLLAAEPGQRGPQAAAVLAMQSLAAEEPAVPLVVTDNTDQVRALADKALASLRAAREWDLRRTGLIVLVGGLVVTVATLLLSLVSWPVRMRRWAPHLAAASLAVILGIFWGSASIDPHGQLSWSEWPAAGRTDFQVAQAPNFRASVHPAEHPAEEAIWKDAASDEADVALAEAARALDEPLPLAAPAPEIQADIYQPVPEPQLADRAARFRMAPGDVSPPAMDIAEAAVPADAFTEELDRDAGPTKLAKPAAMPARTPTAPARPEPFGMGGMGSMRGMDGMGRAEEAMIPMAPSEPAAPSRREPTTRDRRQDADAEDQAPRDLLRSFPAPQILSTHPRSDAEKAIPTAPPVDTLVRYWNPIVLADQHGQYRLSFTLPEYETSYRLVIDGHGDGRIGSKQTEIVVRKESP